MSESTLVKSRSFTNQPDISLSRKPPSVESRFSFNNAISLVKSSNAFPQLPRSSSSLSSSSLPSMSLQRPNSVPEVYFDDDEKEVQTDQSRVSAPGRMSPKPPYTPRISRNALAQCDFAIPAVLPTISLLAGSAPQMETFGDLDVSQYRSRDESIEEQKTLQKLGEVKVAVSYSESTEKLLIVLKHIEVLMKPSIAAVGCNWETEPTASLDFLPCKKRKSVDLFIEKDYSTSVKRGEFETLTLRLTIHDEKRKNVQVPLGHALFPLREMMDAKIEMRIFTKRITAYSQPAGYNKGCIHISLMWNVTSQKLEVTLGSLTRIRKPSNIDRLDYIVKLICYVGKEEVHSAKSNSIKGGDDMNFREKFDVQLTPAQVKESTLLLKLHSKASKKLHAKEKLLVGRLVIGPYMLKKKDRRFSQWEQMVMTPHEEVTEEHILYL